MSKIKLKSNNNGTGVISVESPNTNTDRTLSLPDSTGTLALNSDVTNKLPLAGGTLTGNLNIGSYTANSNADNLVIQEANDFTGITLAADNDQGSNIYFADSEDDNVGGITYRHSTNDMLFRVGGAEKARILSSGGITFNGDSAAANALNDYEEGTWTPGFEGATISGNNGVGFYTKIGNVVYVTYYTGTISISNQSGAARITGLPFTVLSDSSQYSTFYYSHGTAVADSVGGHFTTGQTKMQFVVYNATANAPWVNGTKYAMVSGIYLTTA
nr:hypothetical protein [uncultured Mediterranean phage uvMED]